MSVIRKEEKNEPEKFEELVQLTVRFSKGAYDAFSEIAEKHNLPKAEVVRLAVDNRLLHYLGKLEYIDPKDAEKMRKQVFRIGTELHNINLELNRIGVNFNQQVRLQNIANKYKGKSDFLSIKRRVQEEEAVKAECNKLSPEMLNELIEREEKCLEKFGDVIKKSHLLK